MRVLVTGGLGYIGSHTAAALISEGYEVGIIDNLHNSDLEVLDRLQKLTCREIPFRQADLLDMPGLEKAITDLGPFSSVIHFAAHKAVGESVEVPLQYYQNNIAGLINLSACLKQHQIDNFIFSSSCTVYGAPKEMPVTETSPLQPPASPYGHTKLIGEDILKEISHFTDLRTVSLRYFNPIGAHPSAQIGESPKGVPQNLLPYITQTAIGKRKELKIFGNDYDTPDGTAIRDYIDINDLADAHLKAMEYLNENSSIFFDVFNIGTGRGSSVLEVVKEFERVNKIDIPYTFAPKRSGDIPQIFADTEKANTVLGWKAKRLLGDSLKSAWAWQQALESSNY